MTKAIRRKGLGWWQRGLLLLLALILALLASMLSRSQSPAPLPPPTAMEAMEARRVVQRLRRSNDRADVQQIRLNWAELASLAKLGGGATGIDNGRMERDGKRVRLSGSTRLPLGFWANVLVWVGTDQNGAPAFEGKIGALPLPDFAMKWLIGLARSTMASRGIDVPEPDRLVRKLVIDDNHVAAALDMPLGSRLFQALNRAQSAPIDAQDVSRAYCALVARQKAAPSPDFATQVRRSFADKGDDRARLVALAMLTVSPKVGRMVGEGGLRIRQCAHPQMVYLLLDRADLAQHWVLSAALSAAYGAEISDAIGTWKEISDSAPRGSGFSYVDLAADRSGTLAATRLADPAKAEQTRRWLATVSAAQLLPIRKLALAEGLSEVQFVKRYTDVESPAYAEVVRRIDQELAKEFGGQ